MSRAFGLGLTIVGILILGMTLVRVGVIHDVNWAWLAIPLVIIAFGWRMATTIPPVPAGTTPPYPMFTGTHVIYGIGILLLVGAVIGGIGWAKGRFPLIGESADLQAQYLDLMGYRNDKPADLKFQREIEKSKERMEIKLTFKAQQQVEALEKLYDAGKISEVEFFSKRDGIYDNSYNHLHRNNALGKAKKADSTTPTTPSDPWYSLPFVWLASLVQVPNLHAHPAWAQWVFKLAIIFAVANLFWANWRGAAALAVVGIGALWLSSPTVVTVRAAPAHYEPPRNQCGQVQTIKPDDISVTQPWFDIDCDLEARGFVDITILKQGIYIPGHGFCDPDDGCPLSPQEKGRGKLLCDDLPFGSVVGLAGGECIAFGKNAKPKVSQFGLGRVAISINNFMIKPDGITTADSEWRDMKGGGLSFIAK